MKKIAWFILAVLLLAAFAGCAAKKADSDTLPVKVLILPAFEVNKMMGDFPGEAQYYYEDYLQGSEEYEIEAASGDATLYYKDGVALCLLGEGKVCAALNTAAVLSDERFDFSDAYILLTGCAGSAHGYGILGDVYVITASVDYDLGHHADLREMEGDGKTTWFHDEEYDANAVVRLNQDLTDRVYDLVKDTELETTDLTERLLQSEYPEEAWANRDPQVLRGTSVTGDNFWKGEHDHNNALLMTETYDCPDPYAVTDMEDIAVCHAVDRFGMLDRLIILRDSVNMDVFTLGATPEKLWGTGVDDVLASEKSEESFDIFPTAMKNNHKVGKIIIDAILNGEF